MAEIEQYWKFTKFEENPKFPFLVVDNWYTPEEEKAIWSELNLYSHLKDIDRAEDTIVARDKEGNAKGKSYRWYTSEYHTDKHYNRFPIENTLYKVRSDEFQNELNFCDPYFRSFGSSNRNSNMVSYYEEEDYYDDHYDTFQWTQLVWFYKTPKMFTGGDFVFKEPNVTVNCKHNRAIFFPCPYLHSVTPIKMKQKMPFGHGRWTITHFYYSVPDGK